MSYLSYLSTKYTGTLTTTAQDIRTSASGVTSSGSANVWSSISTAIRHLSQFEYSKSAGVTNDLLITTKERDRSKLGPTSSSAVTYPWDTSETVDLTIGGTDMTASRLSPVTKSSPPFSLSDKPSNVTNVVNSVEGSLSGNTFSNEWVFSQSISPKFLDEQYSTMVKETSRVMKSSFSDHSRSPWLMPVSHTPTVAPSIHESVSSVRKVHETRQSALPSKLTSTESKLVSSGSLRDDFTPVVTIQFPSSPLFTNQGSSADEKAFTPTKVITQNINSSTLGPRSTKQVVLQTEKHSLAISTSPLYNRHYGISTARDVPSLKNTTSLTSLQQTRPSISQPQSEIKATLFDSAVILLKSNSDTKSSSLGSSRSKLSSLPVAMVLSYGSVSPQSSYDNLPTFASEATSHRFSSLIVSQNIVSFIPTSNSKSTLESGKMGTQQWDAPPSTDSVQHPTPKSSVKETNLRAQTANLRHTYQLTWQKGTSTELALSTITSSLITRALSFRQFKTLSQGLQSIAQSLPTGQLTTNRISSHSEKTWLSTVTFSREHLTSENPYETSQHQNRYTTINIISTIIRFSITTVMSNTTTTAGPASRTRISLLDNVGFSSNISSTLRPSSRESLNASSSSIFSMKLNNTLVNRSSDTPENTTEMQNSIATMSPSIQSTIFSPNKSSASRSIPLGSSNISLYGRNATHSQYAFTMETVRIFPSSTSTSTTQVKPLKTTDSNSSSTVLTNIRLTSKSAAQFKIMDGSLVITNRQFHANLPNPNTTMFKALADEVEEIIIDIVFSEAEVTCFRNGSVIANFYLLVAYDSPFSDRDYAEMLSEANETQWRGYQVANITVTLRSYTRRSAARLQDGEGLSNAAVAAIFTVASVLLIAVGCFGVYICKKKGLFGRSRVKPADSPVPPSELEKIQPVRCGTWFMNDEPSLKADMPDDPNCRSTSCYETLNMRVLNNTMTDEGCDPDLLRKSTRSPFEPEYADSEANSDSETKRVALPSASRNVPSTLIVCVDRPISGSTYSEDEC